MIFDFEKTMPGKSIESYSGKKVKKEKPPESGEKRCHDCHEYSGRAERLFSSLHGGCKLMREERVFG